MHKPGMVLYGGVNGQANEVFAVAPSVVITDGLSPQVSRPLTVFLYSWFWPNRSDHGAGLPMKKPAGA